MYCPGYQRTSFYTTNSKIMTLKDLIDKVIASLSSNEILCSNELLQMIAPSCCVLPIYNILIQALE